MGAADVLLIDKADERKILHTFNFLDQRTDVLKTYGETVSLVCESSG